MMASALVTATHVFRVRGAIDERPTSIGASVVQE